jgi:hypothetical protein
LVNTTIFQTLWRVSTLSRPKTCKRLAPKPKQFVTKILSYSMFNGRCNDGWVAVRASKCISMELSTARHITMCVFSRLPGLFGGVAGTGRPCCGGACLRRPPQSLPRHLQSPPSAATQLERNCQMPLRRRLIYKLKIVLGQPFRVLTVVTPLIPRGRSSRSN